MSFEPKNRFQLTIAKLTHNCAAGLKTYFYLLCQIGLISFHVFSIFSPQDEFYQQLQAIRQPWHIPSDTDSDILDPPEQDKSEFNTHFFLLDPPPTP